MVIAAGRLIVRATLWLLRNRSYLADVAAAIGRFQPGARILTKMLPEALPEGERNACRQAQARLVSAGVPEALATRVAISDSLFAGLDVIEVADRPALRRRCRRAALFRARRQARLSVAAREHRRTRREQPLAGARQGGAARRPRQHAAPAHRRGAARGAHRARPRTPQRPMGSRASDRAGALRPGPRRPAYRRLARPRDAVGRDARAAQSRRALVVECPPFPEEIKDEKGTDPMRARRGIRRSRHSGRAGRDAEEDQGHRHDHHRPSRRLDPVLVLRRQAAAGRLLDGPLHAASSTRSRPS